MPEVWRRLYTEAGLLWAVHDLVRHTGDDAFWEGVVARLDMVLIVAGAPGEGRRELVNDLIDLVQETHLPSPPWNPPISSQDTRASYSSSAGSGSDSDFDFDSDSTPPPPKRLRPNSSAPTLVAPTADHPLLLAPNPIPSLPHPPSLSSFLKSHLNTPFILRGYLHQTSWPALSPPTPWSSRAYLLSVAGRGRIVPVEIGGEYTDEGWGQGMVPFEEFLDRIGFGEEGKDKDQDGRPPLYLAQHSLLTQFPKLRRDVLLPDYVYSEPPEVEGGYQRPRNEEGVLMNVWVGGEGRSSPSHTVSP